MQPTKSANDTFILLLRRVTKATKPRIVISKKIAKLAVDRNRIKRCFREALTGAKLEGQGVTVIIKKNIAQYKMSQIKEEIEKMTKKTEPNV